MDYKSNRKKGCRSNDTGGINMEKLIQIKNLTKCFGETKVLDKINVNFDRGHIYGIIGRNGSGKSCLLYTSPSPRDRQKSRMPSSA